MILDRDAFTVEYDPERTSLDDMYSAILELGYTPRLASEKDDALDGESAVKGELPEPVLSGLATAKSEGKSVFVDFYAEWCIACKVLDQKTLSTTVVEAALEDYVVIKVDTDAHPDSAVYHDVVGMPTLLILNADGEEEFRSVGPISAEELAQTLARLGAR